MKDKNTHYIIKEHCQTIRKEYAVDGVKIIIQKLGGGVSTLPSKKIQLDRKSEV